jgi:hypothetical protein
MALTGCQQEVVTPNDLPSVGSLKDDVTGNCLPKTINGTYKAGTALVAATNTINVQLNVTRTGDYTIYTDTINGYHFRTTGMFSSTGSNTITLRGNGTPLTAGTNNFTVHYDTAACTIPITVLPSGVTGTASTGTLGGAGGTCTPATVNGTYTAGTALTTVNTVSVQVNVTTPGTYTIKTDSLNGFHFADSGSFTATGVQSVLLKGSGTPVAAGSNTFTVTYGTGSCTFPVTVNAAAVINNDYLPLTINNSWIYEPESLPAGSDSSIVKVSALTYSAIGNTYRVLLGVGFDASTGQLNYDSSYIRKSGGDYYQYDDYGSNFGFNDPSFAEIIFLKENVPQGTSWYSPVFSGMINIMPFTMRVKYTIEQKDVPVTVTSTAGTVNYINVIVVESHEEKLVGGVWVINGSPLDLAKDYYARGIGWIKSELLNTGQPI